MISTYKHKNVTWVDLENPTQDEVRKIAEKYNLDPLVANDLLTPSSRPIVEEQNEYNYLIFHFPIASDRKDYGKITEIQEIDFILGKNFIITNRYMVVDSLLEFSKTFTVNSMLDKSNIADHPGFIFFYMIKGLYDELENRLASINDLLKDAEEKIFEGKEKEMVIELSKLNRLLLNFKKSVSLHDDVLEELRDRGVSVYGEDFRKYLRYLYGDYVKIEAMINSTKDYISELRTTNDSLLTTKQNETMKIFTIMAFVTFPLTLITSIFGMNTSYIPFIGRPNDFWIVMGIMLVGAIIMFLFFKHKKWL